MNFPIDKKLETQLNAVFDARTRMSKIQVLPKSIPQTRALAKELFQLQRLSIKDYYFLPVAKNGTNLPDADGVFHFVIFTVDPCAIYCGLKKSQQHVRAISGHASITGNAPVYMAGDFTIKQGELMSWNSGSGHYRPQKKHVDNNLLPPVQLLLPRHLYRSYWE